MAHQHLHSSLILMSMIVNLGWALCPVGMREKPAQAQHHRNPVTGKDLTMTIASTPDSTTDQLLSQRAIAQIDAYLDAYFQTGRFSGNVIIAHGDNGIITRSYGLANREHNIANTPKTKFRIGSITKQFTAVAILQLQEREQIDLKAPLSKYLPDYPGGDQITIHHLLTHTSGIPEYLNPEVFPDLAEWMRLPSTLAQIVNRFKDVPLNFQPGTQFKYSNSGYVLLTQIIEMVSGQPYADYIQSHLFAPLGMKNTGYEVPRAVIPNLAQGYIFVGADTHLQADPIDMSLPQGAGGLYSTVEDLAIWNAWLYGADSVKPNRTQTSDPNNTQNIVLSQESIQRLKTPVAKMNEPEDNADTFYGYGLVIDSHLKRYRIHHNGGINGFRSALFRYPEETLTIGVFFNLENDPPEKVAEDLAAILFGEPYDIPKPPQQADIDPALYEQYVGTYQLTPELKVSIRIEDNQLVAQATGQEAFILYPSSETEFFAKIVDITVTFSLGEDGKVDGFTLQQLGQELFAKKL